MLAAASPAGLALATSSEFRLPPHLLHLDRALEAAAVRSGRAHPADRHGPRLMVFMPPRHGKSLLGSQYAPAWYLGRWPSRRVIIASYQHDIASGWGRQARALLSEYGPPIFNVQVQQASRAAGRWDTDQGGGLIAAGIGGGITGRGADLFIIDDPLKDADQAHSAVIRQKHWDWWQSTGRTRLMPGAAVVIIMTRWHEDDLAGRLLAQARDDPDADQWDVLCLPALAEPDHPLLDGTDPLGRRAGEALWPEQFDAEGLRRTRAASGSFWFAAMYQQRPAPAEGGMFRRDYWRRYQLTDGILTLHPPSGDPRRVPLDQLPIFQAVDVAATESTASDYTVILTCATTPQDDLIILARDRRRLETPDVTALIKDAYHRHQPALVGIEDKTFGTAIIQGLLRESLPIHRLKADRDKVTRALPAAAKAENGKVYLPMNQAWADELEEEAASFPNGTHDDQVDALAYACRMTDLVRGAPRRHHNPQLPVTHTLSADDV